MLAAISLSLIAGILALWFVAFWNIYRHVKNIPAPRVWPIVGSALEFKTTAEILDVLMKLFKKLNTKTFRIHMGFRTTLYTKDYKLIEHLLTSQTIISKGGAYRFLHRWLGFGLITSDGHKWQMNRKMITPTFHFHILGQFIDVFNSKGNTLIEKLSSELGNPSTDILPYLTLCALDIICETAMGTCVNAQGEQSSLYANCVKKMASIMQQRIYNPIYHFDFTYKFTKLYQEETAALKVVHGYTDSVIMKRREQLSNRKEENMQEDAEKDIGRKKRTAFLDMLLQATINGVPLKNKDIREQVDTFMFAGHDTTAGGISYALYNLANNPRCQEKAFAELQEILGNDKDRECTYKDLQEMKYLDMVIRETLRMYPSVPIYSRKINENVTYNGMTLPKGLIISIFTYGIQHDPEYFLEPEKFDPERFALGNYDGKQPFAYIPFSAGPRNCIGQKYAMLEMKSVLSRVLRHFELRPASPKHELKLAADAILRPVNGVKISLHERKY